MDKVSSEPESPREKAAAVALHFMQQAGAVSVLILASFETKDHLGATELIAGAEPLRAWNRGKARAELAMRTYPAQN